MYFGIPVALVVAFGLMFIVRMRDQSESKEQLYIRKQIIEDVRQAVRQENITIPVQVPPLGDGDGWVRIWKNDDDKMSVWIFKYDSAQYLYLFNGTTTTVIKHK